MILNALAHLVSPFFFVPLALLSAWMAHLGTFQAFFEQHAQSLGPRVGF